MSALRKTFQKIARATVFSVFAAAVSVSATSSYANADIWERPTLSYMGIPGIVDMPTAHEMRDGDMTATVNFADRTTRSVFHFQIAPRVSGVFRYANLRGYLDENYYDRSFDLRFLLVEESSNRPAVTLGLQDFGGTGIYSGEYLVATKTFGRLRATGGIGWGRFGSHNGFDNPLGVLNDAFKTRPKELPAVFFATAGGGRSAAGTPNLPRPLTNPGSAGFLDTRVPPAAPNRPYEIGIGDVILLATPQAGSTVEQLTGLLAASNARQGYTVQDDGAIAIPNVGRVAVAGMTLEAAEAELFQRLVQNQIDPTFSLEIAEFNSRKVSIGGAVSNPTVAPIGLRPLFLDEALAAAGGVSAEDLDFVSVRIYRDGTLYQIPLNELYSNRGLQRTVLQNGDSVFVDTGFELDRAEAYFEQEIRAAEFRQRGRINALSELQAEINVRRSNMQDARQNFLTRLDLDSVGRDYVYLAGEVQSQSRYALPFGQTANLADALYSNGGIPTETGNVKEIYVLRGSPDAREFGAVTAWQLDGRDASNFLMATRFELRPNDVIFVAEQPVTRWGRVIRQITPSLITTGVAAAVN